MNILPLEVTTAGPGIDLSNLPGGVSVKMADPVKDFKYARNAVTLVYDLSEYENVRLAFAAQEYGDEPHAPPPNPFGDDADFDGVAISADGVAWYEVQDLRHLRSGRFTPFDIDLDAAIAPLGMSYGSQFRIRFCQYDNNPAPMDGIFLHGIELTAELSAPIFHLPMDDSAADPVVQDVAAGQRHQSFLDPGGNPNTDAHAVAGVVGGALQFDGVDDRIVVDLQTGLGDYFAAGCNFTLAFWWKAPTIEFSNLYDYMMTGPLTFEYRTANNSIRFLYYRPVDNVVRTKSYDHSNDGLWHHYAVVREGTTVRLWRDGASDFSNTHENNAGSFTVEQMVLAATIHPQNYAAPGCMDDFRLYSRALTEEEIKGLYNMRS